MNTKTITKCTAILLLAMLSVPAFSQLRFGVRADVGLNNPAFNTDALKVENLTSYSVGPSLELMLPIVNFGIDFALLYNNNRMNVNPTGAATKEIANHYLLLPVNAKKKFGLGILPAKLYATAGPYVGYLISGDKINIGDIAEDVKAKDFQAGLGLGFGVEVFRKLQVGANYRAQLTDNYATDTPGVLDVINPFNKKKSTWGLSATLYF
ncbi:MAG: PorT family protein [Dysgonamonadaceae bacterium]|nr:PorT family protein [Dysgonamonadaceae bacterium]